MSKFEKRPGRQTDRYWFIGGMAVLSCILISWGAFLLARGLSGSNESPGTPMMGDTVLDKTQTTAEGPIEQPEVTAHTTPSRTFEILRFQPAALRASDLPSGYVDIALGNNQTTYAVGELSFETVNFTWIANRPEASFVITWLFLLDTPEEVSQFDRILERGLEVPPFPEYLYPAMESQFQLRSLQAFRGVGDVSTGARFVYRPIMESDDVAVVDTIVFRKGNVGGGLMVKQDGHQLDIQRLAEILEDRLAEILGS